MIVIVFALLLAAQAAAQESWPQWRGPNRDGVISPFTKPATWPDRLELRWRQEIGSGYASPVVDKGKVYLFSRQGGKEVVSCLDLASGKILWQGRYPAPYRVNPAAASHGDGPKSTPVLRDGKLCVFGISGILSCYDARNGNLLWRKSFSDRFAATTPLYGTAMSAMAGDGLLFVHVGGHDDGAFIAVSMETGEIKWSWDGDGPAYASPVLVDLGGTPQLVTFTQKYLLALDPATGKLLWRIPFTTAWAQNSVTPVVHGDKIIFSGLEKSVSAIRIARRGANWTTETVWENEDVSMYMSSPVLVGDLLIGFSHYKKGQFFCLDARTGKMLWVSKGRLGENAAILRSKELLFFLTNEAELLVVQAVEKGFEPIKTYAVAESPTWAHPVLVGKQILIKDDSSITLWTLE